jgi:hypothetical protein
MFQKYTQLEHVLTPNNSNFLQNVANLDLFQPLNSLNVSNENQIANYENTSRGTELQSLPDLPAEFDYLNVEIRRRHKRYPHLTFEEVFERIISPGSDGIEMALRMAEEEDSIPINMSNLYYHNNEMIDVTKLSPAEVIHLATTVEDIEKFEALEHIRSTYMVTTPNVKLYYPEPFIASASFIHNDIGFIHILQYQF